MQCRTAWKHNLFDLHFCQKRVDKVSEKMIWVLVAYCFTLAETRAATRSIQDISVSVRLVCSFLSEQGACLTLIRSTATAAAPSTLTAERRSGASRGVLLHARCLRLSWLSVQLAQMSHSGESWEWMPFGTRFLAQGIFPLRAFFNGFLRADGWRALSACQKPSQQSTGGDPSEQGTRGERGDRGLQDYLTGPKGFLSDVTSASPEEPCLSKV